MRRFAPLLLACALLASACEKPDASHTTSPSALALLGTTEGNVAFFPPEAPPALEGATPTGWDFDVGNVRFSKLENGDPSLQVVMELRSQRGPGFEVWLERDGAPVARWSGGSARPYTGVLCFQLRLEDPDTGEALPLPPGAYTMALIFREPGSGDVVAGQRITVAGHVPRLKGEQPGPGSEVFRVLLSCPRSVI